MPTIAYPNWFLSVTPYFERHLTALRGQPGLRALQIGAYTGDATTWLLDNVVTHPTATLTDVDTWDGSDEAIHHTFNWDSIFDTYLGRVAGRQVVPYRMTSDQFFRFHPTDKKFDFIYVDGDHHAEQVARDAGNADAALAVGGVLAFDDYQWIGHAAGLNPRDAINQFLQQNAARYTILEIGYQVWLRKDTDKV